VNEICWFVCLQKSNPESTNTQTDLQFVHFLHEKYKGDDLGIY